MRAIMHIRPLRPRLALAPVATKNNARAKPSLATRPTAGYA
jgi:hypothetical protein